MVVGMVVVPVLSSSSYEPSRCSPLACRFFLLPIRPGLPLAISISILLSLLLFSHGWLCRGYGGSVRPLDGNVGLSMLSGLAHGHISLIITAFCLAPPYAFLVRVWWGIQFKASDYNTGIVGSQTFHGGGELEKAL